MKAWCLSLGGVKYSAGKAALCLDCRAMAKARGGIAPGQQCKLGFPAQLAGVRAGDDSFAALHGYW